MSQYENDTLARRASLERLKADLQQLEEGTRRLKERAPPTAGVPVKIVDDKQQLVTLKVSGKHVLMLVDASASMLDETLVNIIRLRNMPPERRIQSEKWQQAVNIAGVGDGAPRDRHEVPDLRLRHRAAAGRRGHGRALAVGARGGAGGAGRSPRCGAPRRPAARACRTPSP